MLKTFLGSIANWTMVRAEPAAPLVHVAAPGKAAPKRDRSNDIPIFIHPKALTFPILVGLVKGAWLAVSQLPVAWPSSIWFPFSMCLLLGLLIAISNLTEQKLRFSAWALGVSIGLLNSLVVFGAVIGIHSR
jgi:hypothetical protein